MISFVEIPFMAAMQAIEDGNIKNVYFMSGKDLFPIADYKTNYAGLKTTKYFMRKESEK